MKLSSSRGFTLIELVAVMVIVGILAAVGSQFAIQAIQSYKTVQARQMLVNQTRVAVERITRQLRNAVPNSVLITNQGACVKFLPVLASGRYANDIPLLNAEKGRDSIAISTISDVVGVATYMLVAPMSTAEIYSSANAAIAPVARIDAKQVYLSSSHKWARESVAKRFYLSAKPQGFCFVNNDLRFFDELTLTQDDIDASAPSELVSRSVKLTRLFSLSLATDIRQALLQFRIETSGHEERIAVDQQVFIRNVP